jgi:hypothetical protein
VYGPLVWPLSPTPATSLYRWHVLEDWRLWGVQPVRSRRSESRVPPPHQAPACGAAGREQRLIADAATRGQAQLNIRLLAEYRDGRRLGSPRRSGAQQAIHAADGAQPGRPVPAR